jgi:hypothetical protein
MDQDINSLLSVLEKDPWYIEYLLPAVFTLIVALMSFILSQVYFRYLDRRKAREKYVGILRVILDEVRRNLDLECQLHAYLYVNTLPTFGLSLFVTDRIFSQLTTVCLNFDLLKEIFRKYFEYRHIQNRVDRIIRISNELTQIKSSRPVDHDREHNIERRLRSDRGGTISLIGGNVKLSFDLHNSIVDEINLLTKTNQISHLPSNYLEEKYNQFQTDPDVVKAAELFNIDLSQRNSIF